MLIHSLEPSNRDAVPRMIVSVRDAGARALKCAPVAADGVELPNAALRARYAVRDRNQPARWSDAAAGHVGLDKPAGTVTSAGVGLSGWVNQQLTNSARGRAFGLPEY